MAERATRLVFGPPPRRVRRSAPPIPVRRRLELAVAEAVASGLWSEVAVLLEGSRELVLAEAWGRRLLELAATALPGPGDLPEGDSIGLQFSRFGSTKLGEMPPEEVALELGEALSHWRPLAPLVFGLPASLFANAECLAAGRLLVHRAATWERRSSIDEDPDIGIRTLFSVAPSDRGAVWERAVQNLLPATAGCAYEEGGERLACQLESVIAGPDLLALRSGSDVSVMHVCERPASDVAVCGADLEGHVYAEQGEWRRWVDAADLMQIACGRCQDATRFSRHPSWSDDAVPAQASSAARATIEVRVRVKVTAWLASQADPGVEEFRQEIEASLLDAVVHNAVLHLFEADSDRRWERLAGPLLHKDPELARLAQLPEMDEETATGLLAAFAATGPAASPADLDRRRSESRLRAWRSLRQAAGLNF